VDSFKVVVERTLRNLPDTESLGVFVHVTAEIILPSMKNTYKTRKGEKLEVPQHGYFRRLVSQIFSSLIKRQNHNGLERKIDAMTEAIKDMSDSIEIMAREMARKSKRDN
jgi:hypothetical protein